MNGQRSTLSIRFAIPRMPLASTSNGWSPPWVPDLSQCASPARTSSADTPGCCRPEHGVAARQDAGDRFTEHPPLAARVPLPVIEDGPGRPFRIRLPAHDACPLACAATVRAHCLRRSGWIPTHGGDRCCPGGKAGGSPRFSLFSLLLLVGS
jgi:hypothetical protein